MNTHDDSVAPGVIHLLDGSGTLKSREDIDGFLVSLLNGRGSRDVLHRTGLNYHVVGVFGGQSSGKSTLLNSLFGTRFETLNEATTRGQTTKGAFMSRPTVEHGESDMGALFVLDFEGTDGIERGDNQNFERQLSLFALSVADVLLVNMWAVDVGRFNAANMSLLRTVFEVNLQLFSQNNHVSREKPTLLVVLRDFVEPDTTPYFKTVRGSLDKIWGDIQKPERLSGATIDDVFELRYHALPHYRLQRAEFAAAVSDFRRWFTSPRSEKFLFRSSGMLRGVPIDGLSSYLSSCWDVIQSNKDLDIPTQRDMLAKHRCFEAKSAAVNDFKVLCEDYVQEVQQGSVITQLAVLLEGKVTEALKEFSSQTQLYNVAVVREVEVSLEEELVEAEYQVVKQYARRIAVTVIASVDEAIGNCVDEVIRWVCTEALSAVFAESVKGCGNQLTDFDASSDHTSESDDLADFKKCRLLVYNFWKKLRSSLQDLTDGLFAFSATNQSRMAALYGKYCSSCVNDHAVREAVAQAVLEAIQCKVRSRFSAMAENASETIHHAFERSLTTKEDGTVRFLRTTSGLLAAEKHARASALALLGCLLYYRLKLLPVASDNNEVHRGHERVMGRIRRERHKLSVHDNKAEGKFYLHFPNLSDAPRYPADTPTAVVDVGAVSEDNIVAESILLSQQAVHRAFELYKQKSDFTLQVQLRNIESSRQNIPAWVFPVMLVLGWNELIYVLTSPILLLLIFAIVFVFFKNFAMSQLEALEETCPVWIVVPLKAVLRQLKELYSECLTSAATASSGNAARFRDPTAASDVAEGAVGRIPDASAGRVKGVGYEKAKDV